MQWGFSLTAAGDATNLLAALPFGTVFQESGGSSYGFWTTDTTGDCGGGPCWNDGAVRVLDGPVATFSAVQGVEYTIQATVHMHAVAEDTIFTASYFAAFSGNSSAPWPDALASFNDYIGPSTGGPSSE